MRRLTKREVDEQHGGILPPDATFKPDDEPTRPAATAKPKTQRKTAATAKPKARTNRAGRFKMLNAFTDCTMATLTGAEVRVWFVLFRDTKADTGTAQTGQADIGRRAGITPRAVCKAIAKLQAKGVIQVVRRGRLNTGPSHYRLSAMATA